MSMEIRTAQTYGVDWSRGETVCYAIRKDKFPLGTPSSKAEQGMHTMCHPKAKNVPVLEAWVTVPPNGGEDHDLVLPEAHRGRRTCCGRHSASHLEGKKRLMIDLCKKNTGSYRSC